MTHPVVIMLLLPLVGAAVNMLAGWKLPRRAVDTVAVLSVAGSAVFAAKAFFGMDAPETVELYRWIDFAGFTAPVALRLDALSAAMAVMVTSVSTLIHIYAVGYMAHDDGHARFFGLMNLFVFAMLLLVTAAGLPLMYVGWEGVGLCSYGLIGFWYADKKNADAGRKAFVVTRIGDVAFGVALIWLYYLTGTTNIAGINAAASGIAVSTATFIGLLLLLGAAGKSAQLPLTVWLPDAMAGPTPVSALIHAATMVTAGVYLLIRMFPVISVSPTATTAIAVAGAVTAFYAATTALFQDDIKKVLAYSTISQIGYMFLGVGAAALTGALFHLFAHAFFKALLFMAAGCIIHALDGEQDMRRMGGLMTKMPLVFWSFLAGALGLCAAFGTSGFFSKDEILSAVYAHGTAGYFMLWGLGELTAAVTALYIFRTVYMVFLDKGDATPGHVPGLMGYTLVPLAMLAIGGGVINMPRSWGGTESLSALMQSHGLAGQVHEHAGIVVIAAAVLVPLAGLALGYYMYVVAPRLRERIEASNTALAGFVGSGWGLDGLYHRLFTANYPKLARFLWLNVDAGVVDRSAEVTGSGLMRLGTAFRMGVTGRTSWYLTAVVAGGSAILLYLTVS